jgi:hypothetical protein
LASVAGEFQGDQRRCVALGVVEQIAYRAGELVAVARFVHLGQEQQVPDQMLHALIGR